MNSFTYYVALVVALGGFICGWDIGIISGNLQAMSVEFGLSELQQGSLVSILFAGAVLGCFIGGALADFFGRWKCIHIQNVFYIAGSLSLFYSTTFSHLLCGRFLMGVGTSLSSTCEVPFLCEFTDPKTRGRVGSTYEIMVTLGVLVSYVANFIMYNPNRSSWRTGFGLPIFFAICQSFLLLACPESPKWLLKQGRKSEALAVYKRIYGDNFTPGQLQADHELFLHFGSNFEMTKNDEFNEMQVVNRDTQGILEIAREFRLAFSICFLLNILSQFTGGTTVRVFAPTIFADAGIDERLAMVYNIILGLVKLTVVSISVWVIDRFGRKKLLLVGNALISVGLLVLVIAFSKKNDSTSVEYLVGCALVMGGYSVGWGPVLYLISSEMFPVIARGRALSVSLIVGNVSQLLATLSFLPIMTSLGAPLTFGLYFLLAIMAILFITLVVVETAGKEETLILGELKKQFRDTNPLPCCFWSHLSNQERIDVSKDTIPSPTCTHSDHGFDIGNPVLYVDEQLNASSQRRL